MVVNPARAGLSRHPGEWGWSSYRATAGEQVVPPWLAVEWVLGQFGRRRGAAQRAYRRFVAEGVQSQESPRAQLRHQLYLGSAGFIEQVTGVARASADPEIPFRQRQPVVRGVEEVLAQVARAYGQEVGEVERRSHRPSEARQVAIYAARRLAGEELRALGHRFGLGYTAVSRRVGAVARQMEQDTRFRRKVERILTSKVKT